MRIKKEIIDKIIAHAKKDAPIEACGYLASQNGVFSRHYEVTNIDQSEEHYSFDLTEQFKSVKDARVDGFEVSAVDHSHPLTHARH